MIRLLISLSFFACASSLFGESVIQMSNNDSTNDIVIRISSPTTGGQWAIFRCPARESREFRIHEGTFDVNFGVMRPNEDYYPWGGDYRNGFALNRNKWLCLYLYSGDHSVTAMTGTLPDEPGASPEALVHIWAILLAFFIILVCWLGYRIYHR